MKQKNESKKWNKKMKQKKWNQKKTDKQGTTVTCLFQQICLLKLCKSNI